MSSKNDEKKRVETRFLGAARDAGVPIPPGEVCFEKPDFTFNTPNGALGIELSEVLRPASSNCGILPVWEESVHREIVETAQRTYYALPNAQPVHVSVYFTNANGKIPIKLEMAEALADFVKAEAHRATPVVTFGYKDELYSADSSPFGVSPLANPAPPPPDGLDFVTIVAEPNPTDWWSGECGGIDLSDVRS